MYYVYILKSDKDGTYYVGCTNNYNRRLKEHNHGRSRYTKQKKPWVIVHLEEYITLSSARKREKQIKSWKKRAAIDKLIIAPFV